MKDVKVLLLTEGKQFEKKLNELVNDGYKIITGNFSISKNAFQPYAFFAILEK